MDVADEKILDKAADDLVMLAEVASKEPLAVPPTPRTIKAASTLVEIKNTELDKFSEILELDVIPSKPLKEHLEKIDPEIIEENIKFLIAQGILPPTDDIAYVGLSDQIGGQGIKRKADELSVTPGKTEGTSARKSARSTTPSRKVRETEEQKQEKESETIQKAILEQQAREAKVEFDKKVAEAQSKLLNSLDIKEYSDIPEFIRNIDVCQKNSASVVLNAIYPKDVVEEWTKVKGKDCRDALEVASSAETQCLHVIEPVKPRMCYICGFECDVKDSTGKDIEGIQSTCEHILPIIQAVFFLELYSSKSSVITEAMKLEYAWAHRCCNYVKNDYSFIKTKLVKNFPSYVFNESQTSITLSAIMNITGKFKGLEYVQSKISKVPSWKETRLAYIRDTKMTPILKYIEAKGDKGMPFLIGYKNCLVDKNIHNDFLKLISEYILKAGNRNTIRRSKNGSKTLRRRYT